MFKNYTQKFHQTVGGPSYPPLRTTPMPVDNIADVTFNNQGTGKKEEITFAKRIESARQKVGKAVETLEKRPVLAAVSGVALIAIVVDQVFGNYKDKK